jgi:hypothetical protein
MDEKKSEPALSEVRRPHRLTPSQAEAFLRLLRERSERWGRFFAFWGIECEVKDRTFRLRGPVRQGSPPTLSGSLMESGQEVEVVWTCDRSAYNRFYPRIWFAVLGLFALLGLPAMGLEAWPAFVLIITFFAVLGAMGSQFIKHADEKQIEALEKHLVDAIREATNSAS